MLLGSIQAPVLPDCTIDFEGTCPDTVGQCGASFAGGNGCVVAGLPFCYSCGVFGYEVPPGETLTIDLEGKVAKLEVFFAAAGPGSGQMTFLDAEGFPVDSPITTNGDCSAAMPPLQVVSFSRPVRNVVVEAQLANRRVPKFQLFHLGDDPQEKSNIIDKHPEVASRLKERLASIIERGRSRP